MTPIVKAFDCIEMKDRIQAELLAEKARLGDEEFSRRQKEWEDTANDPLAAWWRNMMIGDVTKNDSIPSE